MTVLTQESELMEGRRRLAEAEGALSVADNAEAALRAAREDAYAARAQYEVHFYSTLTAYIPSV